jgi:diphthine-ammonia ligase
MEGELGRLANKWGVNVCGEGGEYETFTMDCPLFRQKMVALEKKVVTHSQDAFAPVCLLVQQLQLEDKDIFFSESSHVQMVEKVLDGDRSLMDTMNPLQFSSPFHELENTPGLPDVEVEKLDLSQTEPAWSEEEGGWYQASFVRGEGEEEGGCVDAAFTQLEVFLKDHGTNLSEVVKVMMYVDSMDSYLAMNKQYVKYFGLNPPVRVCVGVGRDKLPPRCRLVLSVVGRRGRGRKVLHVQGWSHWAPANIGPYSQGVKVGGRVYISGMIGLVPGNMLMVGDKEAAQAGLAIRHVERVAKVVGGLGLSRVMTVNCYVLDLEGAKQAEHAWKSAFEEEEVVPKVIFLVVEQLPRMAKVEWEVVMEEEEVVVEDAEDDL